MTEPLLDGRYRLISPLAEGGMSVVWRGRDEVLARSVAVKVIKAESGPDPKFAARVRREATALARLSHRHIANVYDYGDGELDGRPAPYLVMELVDGESLGALLRRGPISWPAAVGIAAEVAAALTAAHAAGVVHCDVTPGNVMLSADGVKIIDFGIASTAGDYAEGVVFGTPAYLAPERRNGGRALTASDVYGAGLLLYEMLAGRLPWPDGTATEIVAAHRGIPPAPLPPIAGLPGLVAELCMSCLAVDPAGRPSSRELSLCLHDISGSAYPALRRTFNEAAVKIAAPGTTMARPAASAAQPAWAASAAQPAAAPVAAQPAQALAAPGTAGAAPARSFAGPGSTHGIAATTPGSAEAFPAAPGVRATPAFDGPGATRNPGVTDASPGRSRTGTRIMPHGVTALPDPGRTTEPIDEPPARPRRVRRPFFALPSLLLFVLVVCLGFGEVGASGGDAASPAPSRGSAPGIRTALPSAQPRVGATGDATAPVEAPRAGTVGCRVDYQIVTQWIAGFTARMTVTNIGPVEIAGWSVHFTLASGQRIRGGWNGRWEQHGAGVSVRDARFNRAVPPGGDVTLGFVGELTDGQAREPAPFTLNGAPCDA